MSDLRIPVGEDHSGSVPHRTDVNPGGNGDQGPDHAVLEDHRISVQPKKGGQVTAEIHMNDAASGKGGQSANVSQNGPAPLLAAIRELHRKRVDHHRIEKSLILRIKAICRRYCDGDKDEAGRLYKALHNGLDHPDALNAFAYLEPFMATRDAHAAIRKETEKAMEKDAKQLPIWPWVESIPGVGALSLAQIIGEAGDLSNYANPAKLWKRFGLAVINGERQRKFKDVEKALEHGYSPERRSILWVIGDCIIKKQGPYRDLYLQRKEVEQTKVPDGSKGLWHNRAKRYMEKRFLRDLWIAWGKTGEVRRGNPVPDPPDSTGGGDV
jgi:hypothetical protein